MLDSCLGCKSNCKMRMTTVSANWLAFLYCGDIPGEDFNPVQFDKGFLHGFELIQARYSLTSHEKWKQHDSVFDYADFYYRILNFLTCKANKKWCQSLYSYLNKELFGDE
ncbi:hypothetical protein EDC04DRAFT_2614466 [Pisolithus marmoratus]|nr:hypothetical protein EDC04DRAFT_2614466 [Pisolithus marmoratus]